MSTRGCKGCEHSKRTFEGKHCSCLTGKRRMVNGPQPHLAPSSLKRQASHVHCAPHIHREVSSSPITGDQIDWIREIPALQNRTHDTQLINNARHKNHEVVYIRTKIYTHENFRLSIFRNSTKYYHSKFFTNTVLYSTSVHYHAWASDKQLKPLLSMRSLYL